MPLSELELIKKYLRIDGREDDDILAPLIDSAKADLKDSGVPETSDPRYKILLALHVSLYSENRDPSVKIDKLNFAYQNLLLKLRDYSGV